MRKFFLDYFFSAGVDNSGKRTAKMEFNIKDRLLKYTEDESLNRSIKLCIVGPSGVGKSEMIRNSKNKYQNLVHSIIVDEHEYEAYLNSIRMSIFEIFRKNVDFRNFEKVLERLIYGLSGDEKEIKWAQGRYGSIDDLIDVFRIPKNMTLSQKIMLEQYPAEISAGFVETHYLAFGSGEPIVFVDSLRGAKYKSGSALRYGVSAGLKNVMQNLASARLGRITISILPVELQEEQRVLEELARAYSDIVLIFDSTFFITTRWDGWHNRMIIGRNLGEFDILDILSMIEKHYKIELLNV